MTENENKKEEYVGPYRIIDTLGEGGMAVVYAAEQTEPVKRRVALKILKPGMDSKQIIARFQSERQALAVLDHPNIAKVFDGGITESGRPYFVMEHVKGVPLTDYCDTHRLSNAHRLDLFIDVCSAVQHAHQKGLIHRDLKPSNILVGVVDGSPRPIVIDFGIAKATGHPLTDATMYTRVGQIIGTPQYMSPEQAESSGLDIDTRADVYSLGVILYELLVGAVPIEMLEIADHAVSLVLREKDAAKPSTRLTQLGDTQDEIASVRGTDPETLRRQLRGDLDWIVMRAIEKDRTRRYETVNALAMDCRRYLNNEPVLARPPSAGYFAARFVRRNRTLVMASGVAAVAILAGSAAAIVGYVRATEAEQAAIREAATAKETADFLVQLFEVTDPSEARGNTVTAREILDKGAESVERDLRNQPGVQATMLETIGKVYLNLGLYDDAEDLLQKAYTVGAGIYSPGDTRLTKIERSLGELYWAIGRYDEAEQMLVAVLRKDEASFGAVHERVAEDLNSLAGLYTRLDRLDDAETFARQNVNVRASLYGEDDADFAVGLSTLARILREKGRYPESMELARRALAILDRTLPPDHPRIASTLNEISISLGEQDLFDEQEPYALRMLEIDRKVYGPEHDQFANSLMNVGILYAQRGQFAEAEKFFLEALETTKAALGPVHDSVAFRYFNLGFLYMDMAEYTKSEIYLKRSIEIWTEVFDENHGSIAYAWNALAEQSRMQGRYGEARDAVMKSLKINEGVYGQDHQNTASSMFILANINRDEGQFGQAIPLYEQALRINEVVYGPQAAATLELLEVYAGCLELAGMDDEAAAVRSRLASATD